jgi:hypothetical protein
MNSLWSRGARKGNPRFWRSQQVDRSQRAALSQSWPTPCGVRAFAQRDEACRWGASGIGWPLREPNLWQYAQVNSAPNRKICAE